MSLDLYTMNENFLPDKVVDEFFSVIWTERYSSCGEVQLVVPAFGEYIEMLQEGTFLGLAGTREVMELKTQSVENNTLTVVGETLLSFLDERIHWVKTTESEKPIGDYTTPSLTPAKLGELVADRVQKLVIDPVSFTPNTLPWSKLNLDWERDKIQRLELGDVDHSGTAQRWTVPVGPLYTVLTELAQKDALGMSLYLESADAVIGYVLKFTTYRGVDRTSSQSAVPLIRLTPDMETISDLKEIRSIDGYKNVVYVVYQNEVSIHYEDPLNIPEGFDRRVMVTDAEGEPLGQKVTGTRYLGGNYYGGSYTYITVPGPAEIAAFREQNAKDALANHNYIRALDGQVSQQNEYKFGTDYGLGDIIELEGLTGVINKARITEYIRTQDKTGIREYPTLSVMAGNT
jgi:hypothetical protein